MPETRWLTEPQACQYTGRSIHTLRLWRRNRDVPYSKQDGRTVYPIDGLDACLTEQRRRYDARKCGRPRKAANA
ncbi:helix-turn-helix domain-containing protein [Gordonia sp. NPDC003425]